ncbi:unnamed protein product [Rotaria sp. Silwood1]|nr:unnamed protein product [Rotaria sp. Silwood1]
MRAYKPVPKSSEHHAVQNGLVEKKKNKICRGNRKLQRFRRTCRREAMSNQATEMLNLIKKTNNSVYENIQRMNQCSYLNAVKKVFNTSISSKCNKDEDPYQNSQENFEFDTGFEPPYLLESEMETEWPTAMSATYPKKAKNYNLSNDHSYRISILMPNYKKVSPDQFKDVLTEMVPAHSHHHIKDWLTNINILDFLKQRAELITTVFQLKIQLGYWNYVADLTAMPIVIWLLEIGRHKTRKNSINWDHTKTKASIQKRQRIIQKKLQEAENDINFHLQQPYPFDCEVNNNKTALFSFLNVISNGLITLAERSLYYFRINFEQKRILLHFDINDGYLVKSFYDLNPTEEQIDFVQKIWRDQRKFYAKPFEEQVLSQKLSELSTYSDHITEHPKMIHENLMENIPYYLSKESKLFEQMISDVTSSEMIEALREMAIVIHQLFFIVFEKSLWSTYLKSGTGQLQLNQMDNNNSNHPHLWPIQVQKFVHKQSPGNIDTAACLNYVIQHLDQLDEKLKQYQTKYNMKKNQFLNYLPRIQTFVHQQLESARWATEQEIAIVRYNYTDHVLELQFLAYNPTQQQKKIVEKLLDAKYKEDITKEEYNLLKYRISIEQSSSTSLELSNEKFLRTIEDQATRQKLYDQYIHIAQQAKKDMIQLYLSSAQAQMDRYEKEFNLKLKQLQDREQLLPNDKKLNGNMILLIEQRCKNISEGVKCVYKHKLDVVRLNSVQH